jgi:hypothetical protein
MVKKEITLSKTGQEELRRNEEISVEEGMELLRRKYAK